MNLRASVLTTVLVVIATAAVRASPVGDCPPVDPVDHTDHLPDSKNCSLFYKCDHAAPVLFECPDGLHFNPTLEVCDWPDNAGCTGGSASTIAPSSTAKPPPSGDCPAVGTCPQNEDENSIAKHLPHASNCSQFCKCDHGNPVTFDCPAGLHFNPTLEVCDWPENAGCTGGSSSTPASSSTANPPPPGDCPAVGTCPQNEDENSIAKHLPHASNCSQFCKCDHGKPVTFDCPAGLHFNPTLEVCDWPENAGCTGGSSSTPASSSTANPPPPGDCPAVGTCPQNEDENSIAKHLPHASNCSQFCKCDHGKPVTFDCPAGLHFNPTLEVCDWPENAGCTGGSSSTPASSSTANPPPPGDCPAVGTCPQNEDENSIAKHLPHASNCSQFCKCDHGKPVTFDCPAGLHFNPTLEVCDWPENAGCTGGSASTPESSSTAKPPPSGDCPAVGTCPQNEDENSIAKHLPHASNCSQFCKCDHGNPVTFDCPAGLHFNPTLEVCDWPENAGCTGGSASTPESSSTAKPPPSGDCPAVGTCPQNEDENSIAKHLPHASNCSQFCKCDHGNPVTFDCPAGLHFNPTLEVCDWPENAGCTGGSASTPESSSTAKPPPSGDCPAVGTCPQNEDENSIAKHLPHASNCSQFCKCDHGKPVTFDCPAGLHFNPTLEVYGPTSATPTTAEPKSSIGSGDQDPFKSMGSCRAYDLVLIAQYLAYKTNSTVYCRRCSNNLDMSGTHNKVTRLMLINFLFIGMDATRQIYTNMSVDQMKCAINFGFYTNIIISIHNRKYPLNWHPSL
ncbi:chitin-binding domain protein cbd-1-like [Schistocerca americana]|uniref:chitin-binding domain protein cbd-1-like n=1 Tax=Schistocerca americana TaxID=7009 RepID=UPI001F4F483B|nr:chitin-binding domain protein cbd-1-like [Schistocerca americana]